MKECDKRKSHISSKLHMIYISSNKMRHPVTKTSNTRHYTSPKRPSLNFTTLHPIFVSKTFVKITYSTGVIFASASLLLILFSLLWTRCFHTQVNKATLLLRHCSPPTAAWGAHISAPRFAHFTLNLRQKWNRWFINIRRLDLSRDATFGATAELFSRGSGS